MNLPAAFAYSFPFVVLMIVLVINDQRKANKK